MQEDRVPGSEMDELMVVGLGTSAGGLEALEIFFTHVPGDSGLAYVVVQHLDPNHQSMMVELLQRVTPLPVNQVEDRQALEPDRVYLIPPGRDMVIKNGSLRLLEPATGPGPHLSIDLFFNSLAADKEELALGVILSGMGSDGSAGAKAIKERAGAVFVQDPAEAEFAAMPKNAVATGVADVVAPAAQLPAAIINYALHRQTGPSPGAAEDWSTEFNEIIALLQARSGNDFSRYKPGTIQRRVERRMGLLHFERPAEYRDYLQANPQEQELLFKELLIGVTSFFRDAPAWDYLGQKALPDLTAENRPDTLRAWVVGCGTGEEAYSLAMVCREALDDMEGPLPVIQIIATDLKPEVLTQARRGWYPAGIADKVSAARRQRFFLEENGGYRVRRELREVVVFAPHNVIADPPLSRLDILICRNLLIYFRRQTQARVLAAFAYSLNPGGVLMLGSAETVSPDSEFFRPLEANLRFFRRTRKPLGPSHLDHPAAPRMLRRPFPTGQVAGREENPAIEAEASDAPEPEAPAMNVNKQTAAVPSLRSVVEQTILQDYAPAAVLVNSDGDILYFSGPINRYLESATGKVDWNIFAMIREPLQQPVDEALTRVRGREKTTVKRGLRLTAEGGEGRLNLTVRPYSGPMVPEGSILVVFAEMTDMAGDGAGEKAIEEREDQEPENNLVNQGLQLANEELQSANEELVVSKEEIQALNEELYTVNTELQSRIDELSAANSDVRNLLESTEIITIFLDEQLNIRRFTTPTTGIFRLRAEDVGRPLSDIVSDLNYPSWPEDAREVLHTLEPVEKEVATVDRRWFRIRIMPYWTVEHVVSGLVITGVDISESKWLEAELRQGGET